MFITHWGRTHEILLIDDFLTKFYCFKFREPWIDEILIKSYLRIYFHGITILMIFDTKIDIIIKVGHPI